MLLVVDCLSNSSFYRVFWKHHSYKKPLRKMRKNRMGKGAKVFVLKRKLLNIKVIRAVQVSGIIPAV